MTISYIYNGEPMIGTANDDFFIVFSGSTGTSNNTVNGNNGDDLVIGDSSDTYIPNAAVLNGSIGTAFNLESAIGTWTTGENEMFGDWTIPHVTVMAETTIGQSEFYRIVAGAGQQITIDLDFASNTAIGNTRDLVVELQDFLGNVIVTADDSLVTQGGRGSEPSAPGSGSSFDPYLTYNIVNAGTYYINVRPYGAGPGATFTDNNTFVLNISLTGHAVAATNPVQGIDTINGGFGEDALFGQGGGDVINGDDGDDLIDSGSGSDIVHGGNGNDTLYGGEGTEENIHGDAGNDTLISGGEGHYYGDAGNDLIYAGTTSAVNEILDGGADIDTIDTTTWNGSYLVNLVTGATNFGEFFTNFENIVSGNGADTITGTTGANIITTQGGTDAVNAGAGNDVVAGGADGDTLDGGADFDILSYRTSSGAVTINLVVNTVSGGHAAGDLISNFEGVWGSVLGDTLTADAGNNELRGFEGNDVLSSGAGSDILDGGLNNDTMTGGIGDDTYYVDSLADVVNELPGEGTDTLALGFSYVLANGSAIERLATIDPLATKAINLTGNSGINAITGNAGVNILTGGGGADTLNGLGGDDQFFVDNAGDVVIEGVSGGTDRIFASVSYALGASAYVETLSTTDNAGTGAINLTGNGIANTIAGNAGDNLLDGGSGNDTLNGLGGFDTLVGGMGDDQFYVDNAGDVVVEAVGGGSDRVFASVSYALGASTYVETLSTTNNAGTDAIDLTGNGIANSLVGNAGANALNGGSGADSLKALGGDDTYWVDDAGDVALEFAGQGHDIVYTLVNYALTGGSEVEVLAAGDNAATTALQLVGNELANELWGNAGANVLFGGGGADFMAGFGGDDIYWVDNAGDIAFEFAGQGHDIVYTLANHALTAGSEVEVLAAGDNVATTALQLIGNELANELWGNAGANVLFGGAGADFLAGFGGDDIYWADNAGDVALEFAGQGHDIVYTLVNHALTAGSEVEVLAAGDNVATTALQLVGNALANELWGNAGANVLDGGAGADFLAGFGGADTFRFTTPLGAGNVDTIFGYSVADDGIQVDDAVFTGLVAGALAAGAFNTGAAATQADDRIIYNPATGALMFDADGNGAGAAVQFATLSPGLAMAASEFFVI